MENTELLDKYEKTLEEGLVKVCANSGYIKGELLDSPDVTEKWDAYIKDYVADAVENFNEYPEAAIAWAAFLGMGVAASWDRDWENGSKATYQSYYGSRGWDDMDEHILHDIFYLNLENDEAKKLSNTFMACAYAAMGLMRHEGVEAQTAEGFYMLTRTFSVMYRIGAGVALQRLGYKKVAVKPGE